MKDNYKLCMSSHGEAGLSLTSSQQTGAAGLGRLQDRPLTARAKKGQTSLVIPPSERDVHGDSHMLQTKERRTTHKHTRSQKHATSIIPVHLH